jgi:hypothetical protein
MAKRASLLVGSLVRNGNLSQRFRVFLHRKRQDVGWIVLPQKLPVQSLQFAIICNQALKPAAAGDALTQPVREGLKETTLQSGWTATHKNHWFGTRHGNALRRWGLP